MKRYRAVRYSGDILLRLFLAASAKGTNFLIGEAGIAWAFFEKVNIVYFLSVFYINLFAVGKHF